MVTRSKEKPTVDTTENLQTLATVSQALVPVPRRGALVAKDRKPKNSLVRFDDKNNLNALAGRIAASLLGDDDVRSDEGDEGDVPAKNIELIDDDAIALPLDGKIDVTIDDKLVEDIDDETLIKMAKGDVEEDIVDGFAAGRGERDTDADTLEINDENYTEDASGMEGGEFAESNQKKRKATGGRSGSDLYDSFVRHVTSFVRLSEDEERALGLIVREQAGTASAQDAARKLVVHNLRLVLKVAHQYRRNWTNIMDLVQEASTGMAIAAQRWDPDQGTRFGTYAVYWIRAQLTKFLMTHGRAIHTGNTRAGRKLYFQLPGIRRRLLAAGQEPTIEAIAAEAQESPEEVARIVARLDGREASLQASYGDEDGTTLGDMIASDDTGPEARVAQQEMNTFIGGLIQRFEDTLTNERDLAIWREHLIAREPISLVELGQRYGVTKQRMGQIATRLKRSFRRHIVDELGPHTQLHWLFQQD